MKKTAFLLAVLIILNSICFSASANEEVSVLIPDYQVIIDDSLVYYADSLYPFLNYKGITYIPMTFEYARALNLTTGWLEGTAFMVAYNPCDDKLPVYETTANKKYNTAVVPEGYNVYVNGKKIDNSKSEYPLLNFRGVTYFPATWEYAVDNFGWKISFENNTFRINTDNNTAFRYELIEKRENEAILSLYYEKEIPLGGGRFNYDYITEHYSLDYSTGNMVQLDNYVPSENNVQNTKIDVTVNDGYVYYKEQKLEGVYIEEAKNDYVKPDDVVEAGYTVSAYTSSVYLPLEVVDLNIYTYNYGLNGNRGRKENHTFIKSSDTLIPLGLFKTVENVYELNGDIYFNIANYAQTTFRHYLQNRKLWKLSKEGELKEISYGDYNSIKIIGKANGKLYLKCLWAPENHMDYAPYSVSLVNDGYYTFDGEGIRLVSPYVYSDFDIVSGNGEIFAVNNAADKIAKCEINGEYY